MANKFRDRRNYLASAEYFIDKLHNINDAGLNVALVSENATADGAVFVVHHGLTPRSAGEIITVKVSALDGGGTGVSIVSRCVLRAQFIDFGKNRANAAAVFNYLERSIHAAPDGDC